MIRPFTSRNYQTSLGALAIAALAACSTTSSSVKAEALAERLKDPRVGEQVDRICFTRGINGFRDADRSTVVLTRGVSDDYLVVLSNCPQLRNAQTVALQRRTGCVARGDILITSDSVFLSSNNPAQSFDRCYIEAIYNYADEPPAQAGSSENEAMTP